MKLATGTLLLRKALGILGAIAAEAHDEAKAQVLNRVHTRWWIDNSIPKVTLTAADGFRACSITLTGEGIATEGESVFKLSGDPFEGPQFKDARLHTIFRSANGDVKVIGERLISVGLSATREVVDAFGENLWHLDEVYPMQTLKYVREQMSIGFATDFNNRGVRTMTLNPSYMADGLAIIDGFWQRVAPETEPQRVLMEMPPHPHAPILLTSQYPEKQPLFRIEYILMPCRSP
ncbi:MAG: hypothetical protein WAV09_03235 [Minisyncoccia bacterium]